MPELLSSRYEKTLREKKATEGWGERNKGAKKDKAWRPRACAPRGFQPNEGIDALPNPRANLPSPPSATAAKRRPTDGGAIRYTASRGHEQHRRNRRREATEQSHAGEGMRAESK